MHLPKINSLYGRIFAIFWLTMLLVLIAVLALPHLDPRKTRDLPSDEYQRLEMLKEKIEHTFKNDNELTRILFQLESSSNMQRGEGHKRDNINRPHFFYHPARWHHFNHKDSNRLQIEGVTEFCH